jgi:DNA-binding transcriptional MerR regulator
VERWNDRRRAVSARSYLSIGDVLTLLRQEFPDVTISKIRFLESQGLVNPERTPSGYRKFYEHDVERLRWVLRQQREHFLPLKVIKDRLDEDANGAVEGSARPAAKSPAVAVVAPAAVDPGAGEPVLVGQRARSGARAVEAAGAPAEPSSGLPGIEAGAPRDPTGTISGDHGATPPADSAGPTPVGRGPRGGAATPAAPAAPAAPATRTAAAGPDGAAAPAGARSSGNGSGGTGPAGGRADPPPSKPASRAARVAANRAGPAAPAGSVPPVPAATSTDAPAGTAGAVESMLSGTGGASLTREELVAASGLSDEYVRQLEEFGLITATTIGGAPFFDEEALTVANVAAKLSAFGIEARHLRLYKNAADREAGFIEQIVIPMVRQRNPEARARAVHTADDLARLGQQLKASLLRSALRELLSS